MACNPSELPVAEPRWEGDCIHCAAMQCPPGMTIHCPFCMKTICVGHMRVHQTGSNRSNDPQVAT